MKVSRILLVISIHFCIMSTACAQVGKVSIVVKDYETDKNLANTNVRVGFASYIGRNPGLPKRYECVTNSDGECTIWGHANGGTATVTVMDSAEYYGVSETIRFDERLNLIENLNPIATPWNPTIELRLKEKRNPIPMYAKNLSQKRFPEAVAPKGYDHKKGWLEMPADSGTVAYDLEKGDWVEPYGKGEIADFVFNIQREAREKYVYDFDSRGNEYLASGATIEITVSNDGDGFIPYPVPEKDKNRVPRLPYEAPSEGYVPVVMKYFTSPRDGLGKANLSKDMNYFFRMRAVKDETGKIISAHYGKIYGDFLINSFGIDISFAYYLNPTLNDRNVEFKRGSSLIPNLKGLEDSLRP